MRRRELLHSTTAAFVCLAVPFRLSASPAPKPTRPGDANWPTDQQWEELAAATGGAVTRLASKFEACRTGGSPSDCETLFKNLANPYFIGDDPALTQTLGWAGAWTSATSPYVLAARRTQDIVEAVLFARRHNLRLAVKGGGHSYLGTSNAPDSLLVWTRHMNKVQVLDAFVPKGGAGKIAPQPAVCVEAGAIWMHTYDAVTTQAGRYVQGGGCATVGVAGLVQSGGFGSFSKRFGLAAAGLGEAEIVTADGQVRTVSEFSEPDLFWALKGGGGGTFGVVTRLTLKTHDLPEFFGAANFKVAAHSDQAFRDLVGMAVRFYRDSLFNPHWGEQMTFDGATLSVHMVFQGLTEQEAQTAWAPFLKSIADRPDDFSIPGTPFIRALPARHMWDAAFLRQLPGIVVSDTRPGAPSGNVLWGGDAAEAGQFLHGYQSAWLPADLLAPGSIDRLAGAVFDSARRWGVSLHYNKGLAGAPADVIADARMTATNPAVVEAFALAIIAGGEGPAFPGIPGHEPDFPKAKRHALAIRRAMAPLRSLMPSAASYLSESDYFEQDWQTAYWGKNAGRLLEVKRRYDPGNLFHVRHGVGSGV